MKKKLTMQTVFRIKVSDLNLSFLKTLKSLFKNEREVEIAVNAADDKDETAYLLSTEANRHALEKSLAQAEAGNVKEVKLKKLK